MSSHIVATIYGISSQLKFENFKIFNCRSNFPKQYAEKKCPNINTFKSINQKNINENCIRILINKKYNPLMANKERLAPPNSSKLQPT